MQKESILRFRNFLVSEGFAMLADQKSPRYIQDKISNALVYDKSGDIGCVNPFMVMNELEGGLKHHALLASDIVRKFRDLVGGRRIQRDWIRAEDVIKHAIDIASTRKSREKIRINVDTCCFERFSAITHQTRKIVRDRHYR